MKRFNRAQLQSAVDFLSAKARPLERARWTLHAGTGSPDAILSELEIFRNPDGGFGRALEPDHRSPRSSVLATLEALAILAEIEAREGEALLDEALDWLVDPDGGYDPEIDRWSYLPPEAASADHAPWWDPEGLDDTFASFVINPRARVLAFLARWPHVLPEGTTGTFFQDHLSAVVNAAEVLPGRCPPDALRCLIDLGGSELPDEGLRNRLKAAVRRLIPLSVDTDPAAWSEYGLQPLDVVSSPESPWMPEISGAVEAHLDYLVDRQDGDGSWKPFWSWGGRHPESWDAARTEWSGILTLRNLRILERFGRLP